MEQIHWLVDMVAPACLEAAVQLGRLQDQLEPAGEAEARVAVQALQAGMGLVAS